MAETIEKIGKLLDGTEGRDAVHIAVIPATSADRLVPGERVGLVLPDAGIIQVSKHKRPILGIVDPFLPRELTVEPGSKFLVFLIPQTITSLRHVWTHPALPDEE